MQTSQSDRGRAFVIADRNPHIRETLKRVLWQMGIEDRILEAATFRQALRFARSADQPVVLLDVEFAIGQPAGRLRRIVEGIPDLEVVVLLNEDLPGYRKAIAERWSYECIAKERAEVELPAVLQHRSVSVVPREGVAGSSREL